MKEFEDSLVKMGYREVKESTFAKPIGCGLFTYELDKRLWTNWFKSQDKIHIWKSEEFTKSNEEWEDHTVEEAFLSWLKVTEGLARLDYNNSQSQFEFLTKEEQYNEYLNKML